MAKTEPASPNTTGQSQSNTSPDSSLVSRPSRIHFPAHKHDPSRTGGYSIEGSQRAPVSPLRPSSARHNSPFGPHNGTESTGNGRLRVRAADTGNIFADYPRSKRAPPSSLVASGDGMTPIAYKGEEGSGVGLGVFSDEYDLSHEDPKILQDVQRALKLKARREARLKSGQTISPRKDTYPRSDVTSGSLPTASSPPRPPFPVSAPTDLGINANSEIDFSPSTGGATVTAHHPVPSSLDDGVTLDWTGSGSDDERSEKRWSLSIPMRKGKEKALPLSSMLVEKQESRYEEKIDQIKAVTTPHTIRKAAITSEQLRRRYKLVYGTLVSGSERLNPAKVARWYGSQEAVVRASLEKAEPFTWLKHLEKRGVKPSSRLPWHLSALIIEEYIHSQTRHDPMETILEDPPSTDSSPNTSLVPQNIPPLPQSHASSHYSLGASLSRRRSFEEHISFEPLVDSVRNSLEVDSRKSGESAYSSMFNGSPYHPAAVSPTTSRLHLRDIAQRLRPRLNDSDDASSVRNSISERSDDGVKGVQISQPQPRAPDMDLHPYSAPGQEPNIKFVVSGDPSEGGDTTLSSNEAPTSVKVPLPGTLSDEQPQSTTERSPRPPMASLRVLERRRVRISLPSSDRLFVQMEQKRQQEATEVKAHHEYELKIKLLEETTAQNSRIRQLLNRVAAGVREYEMLQSTLMESLGMPYTSLPQELLDAFGHDPAAVTGSTRKFRGWRAVDDIHNRLVRQRDTFQHFLSRMTCDVTFPAPGSVLDDPIVALLRSLETLEIRQQEISTKANDVANALKRVKAVHADVKSEYNNTLSHTSVVYPELSHIVALEESYKDQYQQFWEIGMDALTFLLDTVTPFWRTYGKTIGEDMQDFLIIPLYRNEFTGETKRYPIKGFPRRSFRHWMGLASFFVISVTVNLLQGRAAVASSSHCRLQWITHLGLRWTAMPFFWIGIIIQWCAVMTELFIVLMQLGVLAWWIGWSVKIFN